MATPVEGTHAVMFINAEATFNTYVAFVATDAVEFVRATITPTQNKIIRKGHTGDASPRGRQNGKRGGTFRIEVEFKVETTGTEPEASDLLIAAHGTGSQTHPSSDTLYSLTSGHPSLQIGIYDTDDGLYQQLNGAIVRSIEFIVDGDALVMLVFEGEFASYGSVGGSPVCVTTASGTTTSMARDETYKILRGNADLLVDFGTEDNGGSGYQITGIDYATGIITFTPTLVGTTTAGEFVVANNPAPTFGTGLMVSSMESALTLGLVAGNTEVGFISANMRMNARRFLLNREANTVYANRAAGARREITGTIQFYYLDENAMLQGMAYDERTMALSLRLGPNTASQRATLSIPNISFDVHEIGFVEVDEEEVSAYQLTLYGQMSAAANDEWTLTLN